jgi:hypothetical protein
MITNLLRRTNRSPNGKPPARRVAAGLRTFPSQLACGLLVDLEGKQHVPFGLVDRARAAARWPSPASTLASSQTVPSSRAVRSLEASRVGLIAAG